MNFITPILLAGGSGTRLWPSSRKNYPKQFTKLTSNKTLFQQAALRFVNTKKVKFNEPTILTNSLFRFIVSEQLQDVGIDPGLILIEPEVKNTAPAIIAGTIFEYEKNKDAIIITTPSDHVIPNTKYFNEVIHDGLAAVKNGNIITLGIYPSHPETGYGYLKIKKSKTTQPKKVIKFIEKPNKILATKMLQEENYLWNSGIFMFRAEDMINAFNKYAKNILLNVTNSIKYSVKDMQFTRLDPNFWKNVDEISIDYAIMEKAKNLVAIPYNSSWSDLGNWESVWREAKQDKNGVVLSKNSHAIDCKNSYLRTEDERQQIVGLGLKDIVAIAMPDAVLVANKNKSQKVKNIVEYLKNKNISQSEEFTKDHRPWGWFESLTTGEGFQVKRIFVKPGASLSLQSHKCRSEHWIVVKGVAKITVDKDIKLLKEGQSTYVPLGSKHRLENPGEDLLIVIEVQIGSYLGEDDIIRYQDLYSR